MWPVTAYHRSALPDRVRTGTSSEWTPDETKRRAHRLKLTPLTFTERALESASLLSGIFVHAAYTIFRRRNLNALPTHKVTNARNSVRIFSTRPPIPGCK